MGKLHRVGIFIEGYAKVRIPCGMKGETMQGYRNPNRPPVDRTKKQDFPRWNKMVDEYQKRQRKQSTKGGRKR